MALYFITGNQAKFEEVKALIPNVELWEKDFIEIQEVEPKRIIEAKIEEAFKLKVEEFLVEDTGLYLDCLKGMPGPLIKWFLIRIGNHGIFELCQKYNNFKAQAKTIIGYANKRREVKFFEGVIDGIICLPRGNKGFGWDSIFQPDNLTQTLGEMEQAEKNEVSMRRLACRQLQAYLSKMKN